MARRKNEKMKSSIKIKNMKTEPYVHLQNEAELRGWDKENEISYNQQLRQKAKVEFYQNAFDFLYSHSIVGDYFEFGCHKIRTFRMALTEARKKNFNDMSFLAFDSFEGSPDYGNKNKEHNNIYTPGGLSTSEQNFMGIIKEHGLFINKVKTFKGFYEKSLNCENKQKLLENNHKISLVTLDCSFYSSFVTAFDFIEDFLQEGSIIYIDDYRVTYKGNPEKGVPLAFKEFKEKSKFKYEEFLNVGWFGKSYIVYK